MDDPETLIARHRSTGVFLDAGLLLLLTVGMVDPDHIPRFKRTSMYTRHDFDLLGALSLQFERILVTPHVIAETSNLAGQLKEPFRSRFFATLLNWLIADRFLELNIPTRDVLELDSGMVGRLGIPDCVTIVAARRSHLIVTSDVCLSVELQSRFLDVLDFNYWRLP